MKVFDKPVEFQWDRGNVDKNQKHKVEDKESEEPFFDKKHKVYKDAIHSDKEERYITIGKTRKERLLYIVFTMKSKKVRIVSARSVNKKEVQMYEKTT